MIKHTDIVSIESLRNKTIAIDGHIWLYESNKGCHTHGTSGVSYLVTFFNRCQRLLEYNIELIVVFDNINSDCAASTSSDSTAWQERKKRRAGSNRSSSPLSDCADKVLKIQILLRNMGIRCLVAESDGEAQCAQLEMAKLTHGCITSDFDYFLFGGMNLYKINYENGGKTVSQDVIHLSMDKLETEHHLSRNRLIALSMLLGCDYYDQGVGRVGMVTALEILSEFTEPAPGGADDHPVSILDRFAAYHRREIPERADDSETKKKLRKKVVHLPDGFPNTELLTEAVSIYLLPKVLKIDHLTFPSKPFKDMDVVMNILSKTCGWKPERFDEEMERSEKRKTRLSPDTTQTKERLFPNTEQTSDGNSSAFTSISGTCESMTPSPDHTQAKRRSSKKVVCEYKRASPAVVTQPEPEASETSSIQILN
ncbi:unnamed protein product [Caenorhabditis auriculariae]|uniref:XPG-I domain-containing protein n=1 Tax=Caenorhabditis auriculariae TaxID=2777116 RepID=A0A8S1H026_9PELO|nr:unnamed protein product [Caenorhabditis auriculariae]